MSHRLLFCVGFHVVSIVSATNTHSFRPVPSQGGPAGEGPQGIAWLRLVLVQFDARVASAQVFIYLYFLASAYFALRSPSLSYAYIGLEW